jgi:nitrate/nitrite transporter NarK
MRRSKGEVKLTSRQAIWRVVSHSREHSSRLIWIYAIAMGAYQGSFSVLALFLNDRFQVTEQDDWLLLHVRRLDFCLHARAVARTHG